MKEGQVDYGYKDEWGKSISDEAAHHMAKNRINCSECHLVFCGSCNVAPYHLGKTCEEFSAYKESSKCRFCDSAIENVDPNQGALANVCDD